MVLGYDQHAKEKNVDNYDVCFITTCGCMIWPYLGQPTGNIAPNLNIEKYVEFLCNSAEKIFEKKNTVLNFFCFFSKTLLF